MDAQSPQFQLCLRPDKSYVIAPSRIVRSEAWQVLYRGSLEACEERRQRLLWRRQVNEAFETYQCSKPSPDPDKERRVAFIKLRKTGGTTFASSVLFPYCVKHNLRYMKPHHPPGWGITKFNSAPTADGPDRTYHMMFRHFPAFSWDRDWLDAKLGGSPIYLTIVRHPVDRAISWYNHLSYHHRIDMAFEEYLETTHEPNHQSMWLGRDFDSNVLDAFDAVGTTDRLNESMLLFGQTLDMDLADMLYVSQRAGLEKRVKRRDLTDETVARICEIDHRDMELYSGAAERLTGDLAKGGRLLDQIEEFERALSDLSHPLWEARGPFKIGYAERFEWLELTGDGALVQLREQGS